MVNSARHFERACEVGGEEVTYYPAADLNAGRTFKAILHREPEFEMFEESPRLRYLASFPRSATATVGVESVARGDLLDAPWTSGGSATRVRVVDITEECAGGWTVKIERVAYT